MRIIAFAYTGGGGDFHPVVALCLGLRARGHDVALICDPEGANDVAPTGLPVDSRSPHWSDVAAGLREASARIRASVGSDATALKIDLLSRRTTMLSPIFAAAIKERRPDLGITAMMVARAAREAATASAVPWCVVNSTWDTRRDQDNPLLRWIAEGMSDAPLLLHSTDPVFDDAVATPGEHYVGPMLWESPRDPSPSYLSSDGPPWALVTVSLLPQGDIAIVPVALRALSDLGLRSVATIGRLNDPSAVGAVPANARVEVSISHAAVLERARIMVGHAGYGSVSKAMWYGVPMALVPWGRDQPGVASRAERLGLARVVPPDKLSSLPEAIRKVLQDDGYSRRAVKHSRRLRATDPVRLACDIIERTFAPSASQSAHETALS